MAGTNLGRWDHWYAGADSPTPYADTASYRKGAAFLEPCATIEDWGSGLGWFREMTGLKHVVNIDGSQSQFVDVIADLTRYTSDVEGIFMRHVLEHNEEWAVILNNVMRSFTKRFVLVLFTPLAADFTHQIAFAPDPGVPDISFKLTDILAFFTGCTVARTTFNSHTQYGTETILFVERH